MSALVGWVPRIVLRLRCIHVFHAPRMSVSRQRCGPRPERRGSPSRLVPSRNHRGVARFTGQPEGRLAFLCIAPAPTRNAVPSQSRFTRGANSHEFDVHFLQSTTVARSPSVAVVTRVPNVKGVPSNKPIKLTVRVVTGLACARPAPPRPAAYRRR